MVDTIYTTGSFRQQSGKEFDLVAKGLQVFSQLHIYRTQGFAGQWEEVAELMAPNYRNTFVFGNYNTPGQKKTDRQIDATAMMANERFAAICNSLLTPRNQIYQRLRAGGLDSDYIMKDRDTRLWFEQATKALFYYRYLPEANFSSQNMANFLQLGAFGNMGMFTDRYDDPTMKGLRYSSLPLGEVFIILNHQNKVCGFIRWYRLTAYQAEGKWPGQLPPSLQGACEKKSEQLFDFLQWVHERDDYDPQRLDAKGKRYRSVDISMDGKCLMYKRGDDIEGGYYSFPLAFSRYSQGPQENYGRGWAMMVLPAIKTLNEEKTVFLKQGHRAIDPVLLTGDDGLVGMSLRPGAMNPGGVNSSGQPLVHVLPTGDIHLTKEMMEEERNLINDAALVTLFQILVKTPQMSATEVIERANEKGILLAPTLGRQQDEYLGNMTPRELDLLQRQRLLGPMPPRLKEAVRAGKGSFHIVYDNPLSRLAQAQKGAGFLRTIEAVKGIMAVYPDPALLDPFNFNTAIPALADQNATPESWMADKQQMAKKAQDRAKQAQAKQASDALPNQAAMVKANAVAAKAGQQPNPSPPQQGQPQQEQQGM